MALTATTPIQIRFFDTDMFGHVSNVAQQMYFDQGKTDLFRTLWDRTRELNQVPVVTVSVHTDFFRQIMLTDQVRVLTRVESIGNKSLTLAQSIMCGDEECSRSRAVMVVFDMASRQSVTVPEAWRRVLGTTEFMRGKAADLADKD